MMLLQTWVLQSSVWFAVKYFRIRQEVVGFFKFQQAYPDPIAHVIKKVL